MKGDVVKKAFFGSVLSLLLITACHAPADGLIASDALSSSAADQETIEQQIEKYFLKDSPEGKLVKALPEPKGKKLATVLSYRAMDNDLAPSLKKHLNEMEAAGSSTSLNLVTFTDSDQEADGYYRYLRYDLTSKLTSPYLAAFAQEVNSADPATLRKVVDWGFDQYPAQFKVLDMASHGEGYRGMATDFTSGYQTMSLDGFGDAVKKGLKGRSLDVLNLLACLMSTAEVAYEFRDVSDVMIASQDLIRGDRVFYYTPTLTRLANQKTKADARELGRQLVLDARPESPGRGSYTLAALDLTQVDELKSAFNRLSNALRDELPQQSKQIAKAYRQTPVMAKDQGSSSHRDLSIFCDHLRSTFGDRSEIGERALAVKQRVKAMIITAKEKKMEKDVAKGLSLYMPDLPDEQIDEAYGKTRWAKDTSWDEFLVTFQKSL